MHREDKGIDGVRETKAKESAAALSEYPLEVFRCSVLTGTGVSEVFTWLRTRLK